LGLLDKSLSTPFIGFASTCVRRGGGLSAALTTAELAHVI
jgi:hypothetical protein